MGFGGLCLVLPNRVLSQTIYDTSIQPPPTVLLKYPDPEVGERLYLEWQLTNKAKKLVGKHGGQCVTFARNFAQATTTDVSGLAKNVPTSTTTPEIGAIVKTKESKWGHLAVVIGIDNDTLTLVESNYHLNQIIDIRELPKDDPRIVGYLNIN